MPKVSVILTSYNHEKFIGESIRSVLNQSFTDFELIIWDDASSDNSWQIINSFSDSRIRSFQNPERYMGGSANRGISIASGDYIAIHHSDDVWESDKLEKQVSYLDGHPDIGAVFSNAHAIDERGLPLATGVSVYFDIFDQKNRSRHEWLNHFFFHGNALCHPSVLIRKVCYEDCGKYPAYGLAQLGDFDMWIRLCLKHEIHVLPEKLVKFRVRDNAANVSGNRPEVRIRDRSEFHHILKHYFRIDTFDELVAIFPETAKYYREDGCVPQFVMAMVAVADNALQWAKLLGIQTLYDLLADETKRRRIETLYHFDYRDMIALAGRHDVFLSETVAQLHNQALESNDLIAKQAAAIASLEHQHNSGKPANPISRNMPPLSQQNTVEADQGKEAYKTATKLIDSGKNKEGLAILVDLAHEGSNNWEVYNDIAVEFFKEGEYQRANPYFIRGLGLEGCSGTTARNFATMLTMSGELEAALAVWGAIIHDHPEDPVALNVIREILSNVNAIRSQDWLTLISNIRGQSTTNIEIQLNEILTRPRLTGSKQGSTVYLEQPPTSENKTTATDIRIFQIYYDEQTRSQVDPSFIPLNNTENARPDWCEYWSIRKVLLNETFDENCYLGFFSPRFYEKTAMEGKQVIDVVMRSSDEVLSFSPYFDQGAIHANPFVQGERNHPGLLEISQSLLAYLNIDLKLDTMFCDQTTTIFSNYFVARYSFWKKWLSCAEKIFALCEGPECELKTRLISCTPHRNGQNYAMKVFVIERLVTVVMEQLEIRGRVAIDIEKAPMLLPTSRDNLAGLLICDALKGQYRNTGLTIYRDLFNRIRVNA
jgi:glycosyltransferase involved in cell wall biosynthesis